MSKTTQTILISGGTKGIGKETIQRFSAEGFDVITCARDEQALKALKEETEKEYGNQVYTAVADLSDKKAVFDFIDFVQGLGRQVDVLVNNAGRFVPAPIHEEADGVLEDMLNTNLMSAYHISRAIIPGMKERQSGHIFNICSVASLMAYPTGGSYSISKFALYGMSKGLREELKPFGIRVTALLPGATFTASWEGADVEKHRLMKAEDIAELIWAAYSLSLQTVVEDIIVRPQLGDL
jgi:hypothetical protein